MQNLHYIFDHLPWTLEILWCWSWFWPVHRVSVYRVPVTARLLCCWRRHQNLHLETCPCLQRQKHTHRAPSGAAHLTYPASLSASTWLEAASKRFVRISFSSSLYNSIGQTEILLCLAVQTYFLEMNTYILYNDYHLGEMDCRKF